MAELPRVVRTNHNDIHYYDCDVLETFSMSSGTLSYDSVARNKVTQGKIKKAIKTKQDHRDASFQAEMVNILDRRKPRVEEIGETALRVINRRRRKQPQARKFKVENLNNNVDLLCGLIEDAFSSILSKENKRNRPLKIRLATKQTPMPIRTIEFIGGCYDNTNSDSDDSSIFEDVDEDPLVDVGLAEQTLEKETKIRREKLFPKTENKDVRPAPSLHTKQEIDKRLAKIGKKC